MPRQMLVQGQVYRLEPPRKPGLTVAAPGRAIPWGLVATAALGLSAAGIVALLGHGGAKDAGPPPALANAASKATVVQRKPASPGPASAPSPGPTPGPAPSVLAQAAPAPPQAPAPQPAAPVPQALPPQLGSSSPPASAPERVAALAPAPIQQPTAAGPAPFSADAQGPGRLGQPSAPAPAPAMSALASRDNALQPAPGTGPASTASVGAPSPAYFADPSSDMPLKPAAAQGANKAVLPSTTEAPTACLPAGLRSVLADVGARFGAVTLVSTTHLHTDNHTRGSARAQMHEGCKAVDFKVAGATQPVLAYLKKRPEVNGINLYKNNGVIHIDATGEKVARRAAEDDEVAEAPSPKRAAQTAAKPAQAAKATSAKKAPRQVARRSTSSAASRTPQTEYDKAFDAQGNPRAEPTTTE